MSEWIREVEDPKTRVKFLVNARTTTGNPPEVVPSSWPPGGPISVANDIAAGVPPHVVSRRLGQASEAFTLSQYSHVLPQQGAHAAAAFADAVRDRSTPASTGSVE